MKGPVLLETSHLQGQNHPSGFLLPIVPCMSAGNRNLFEDLYASFLIVLRLVNAYFPPSGL